MTISNDVSRSREERQLTHAGNATAGALTNVVAMATLQPLFVAKSWKQHGLPGLPPFNRLGKGVVPNCASGTPLETIGFAVESLAAKYFPGSKTETERFGISLFAGFLGAPTTTIIERPMLVSHMTGATTKQAIQMIYAKEGLRGFFKGNIATIGRECGYHISLFALADTISQRTSHHFTDKNSRERAASLTSGAIIGILTNPFDRIKALMQGNVEGKFSSFTNTAQYIVQKEGWHGLTRGTIFRAPSLALAALIVRESKAQFIEIAPDALIETKIASDTVTENHSNR